MTDDAADLTGSETLQHSQHSIDEAKEAAREATADMPGLEDSPQTETGRHAAAAEQAEENSPSS